MLVPVLVTVLLAANTAPAPSSQKPAPAASAKPAAPSSPATPSGPAGASKREVGALVLNGVPEVSQEIQGRVFQYQNTRSAHVLDWDANGLLIKTRFGDSAQVHHVKGP